jgi:hypothetical protein
VVTVSVEMFVSGRLSAGHSSYSYSYVHFLLCWMFEGYPLESMAHEYKMVKGNKAQGRPDHFESAP